MDVREKLVELLNNSFEKQSEKRGLLTAPHTADDLIANGVTVQEWISVEDRLPENMDDVLVWYEYRAYEGSGGLSKRKVKEYGIGCYIPQMGVWGKDPGIGTEARVIAWMPLPEPPDTEVAHDS